MRFSAAPNLRPASGLVAAELVITELVISTQIPRDEENKLLRVPLIK